MREVIRAKSHVLCGRLRLAALALSLPIIPGSLHASIPPKDAVQPIPPKSATASHSAPRKSIRARSTTIPAPQPAPEPPPAPKPPDWPVNDRPVDATVVWNSQGLSIQASNSSLSQILKDVSTATGAKIQGISTDSRIFGTYGPGTARDVLGKLLEGSGYNVLLIGDQGQGTPREIILSSKPKGNAPPGSNNNPSAANDDSASADDNPPPDQPEPPPPLPPNIRNGFEPGAQPRTPQQIMQEMQQRQQQQQQMQQQLQQPPNP